jgi:cytoskeletal protein RodZ
MKRTHKTHSLSQLVSAAFMILALLWLTVSVAFVFPTQQQLAKQDKQINAESSCTAEDDANNPFSNTTEEKSSSNSNSFSEEYLHDPHTSDDFISVVARIHNSRNCGTYNAFHGEVHVPPPNIA